MSFFIKIFQHIINTKIKAIVSNKEMSKKTQLLFLDIYFCAFPTALLAYFYLSLLS